MTRRSTPGLTNAQLVTTAIANLQDAAESWYFTENTKYYQLTGANLVDDWEGFKRLFLQRYGKINSLQCYFELQNMKMGDMEGLLIFAQRLRNRIFEANINDENVKKTIFINALDEPLKSQVNTRMPATLEQAIVDAEFLNYRIKPQDLAA